VFVAVYRFHVADGADDRFRDAWRRLTEAIHRTRGSLGSRLHRADDGTWVAYAQWPSREVYDAAAARESADPEASAAMRACLAGPIETTRLDVTDDLLARTD
jgi:quinol monooxygenase YgiN